MKKLLLIAGLVIAVVGVGSMFAGNVNAVTCTGAPSTPTFNPFPVTYTDENCKDFPAIDARLVDG